MRFDKISGLAQKFGFKYPVMLLLALLSASLAWALSLDEAKNSGLVGEQRNGYLGIVVARPSAELKHLVEEINSKRREVYQQIAQRNDLSLEAVTTLAGRKAVKKTAAGNYVQGADNGWQKKSPNPQ